MPSRPQTAYRDIQTRHSQSEIDNDGKSCENLKTMTLKRLELCAHVRFSLK